VLPDERTANCFIAEAQGRRGVLSARAEPFPKILSFGNRNDLLDTSLCVPCVSATP